QVERLGQADLENIDTEVRRRRECGIDTITRSARIAQQDDGFTRVRGTKFELLAKQTRQLRRGHDLICHLTCPYRRSRLQATACAATDLEPNEPKRQSMFSEFEVHVSATSPRPDARTASGRETIAA